MQRMKKRNLMKKTKTRQRLDKDETVLLLATRKQGKSTLRCCCQSTRPIVNPLPPPSSSLIPWTRHLSFTDTSIVVALVFVLIYLLRRLRRRHRFLGTVVKPPPPLLLSPIPRTRRVFLVLFQHHCCRRGVRGPVLL